MSRSSSSNGCGSCGGTTYRPPAPSVPTYDRCAGGLELTARPREPGCGCGGSKRGACTCSSARPVAPTARNYNKEDCPTLAISCETKQVFRDCAKVALCDFLACLSETLCPDGRFDLDNLKARETLGTDLINCVGQLACSFMHCIPEALCPEPCATEVPVDCLPCGYAVEVLR